MATGSQGFGKDISRTRMRQPKSLEDLASTAMAIYIADVCTSLLESIETCKHEIDTALMNALYEGFKSAVVSNIPTSMANRLTNLWLTYMDWRFRTSKLQFTEQCDAALLQIIRGVIHPRVTHLNCTSAKIQSMVYRNLDMMKRLKQLQVSGLDRATKECLVNNIMCLTNLVHLHIHFNCTDQILALIGESCPNIVDLDVFGSPAVGNESVSAILKLSGITALDIYGTSISLDYSEKILQVLKDRGNFLKKFGCNSIQAETLDLLLNHKQSLIFLRLAADLIHMFGLTTFTYLKGLIIHCSTFSSVENMLCAIGPNLVHMELHGVSRVDVSFIGLCCPRLVKFEMHNCTYSPWTHLKLRPHFPMFTELQILKLHLMSKYPMLSNMDNLVLLMILSDAQDIKQLSVGTYSNIDEGFIRLLLIVNSLKKLEEFKLGSTSETLVHPRTLIYLLKECHNLYRVTVNGTEILQKPLPVLQLW